jgi:subtilisin family serine protease
MRNVLGALALAAMLLVAPAARAAGLNVVLNTDVTDQILAELGKHGNVRDVIREIDAVTLQASPSALASIRALPFVAAANADAARNGIPIASAAADSFEGGLNTWNLDAVNVTDFGATRTIGLDGGGVYVAVLDSGLLSSWRTYFASGTIAEEWGASFGGGGGEVGTVSTQPNKWEQDQNSHGTHVTSTILGYSLGGTPVNGVAPKATVIPVKVLNQNGSGWSSVIARGIVYVTDLKRSGELGSSPLVVNMSLGGSVLDAVEKAAIDYAVANGVLVVASAGNEGTAGMGYPGAYAPVISVAASGWIHEWKAANWWRTTDVAEPTKASDFYITDFSSRALSGQDLDVAAPGSWVVGPYQTNGQLSYYYLGGTSMAAPHVSGIVALMAQRDPGLTQAQAESALEAAALRLDPGCRNVIDPNVGAAVEYCWGADATGAGLITADAALGSGGGGRGRRR